MSKRDKLAHDEYEAKEKDWQEKLDNAQEVTLYRDAFTPKYNDWKCSNCGTNNEGEELWEIGNIAECFCCHQHRKIAEIVTVKNLDSLEFLDVPQAYNLLKDELKECLEILKTLRENYPEQAIIRDKLAEYGYTNRRAL